MVNRHGHKHTQVPLHILHQQQTFPNILIIPAKEIMSSPVSPWVFVVVLFSRITQTQLNGFPQNTKAAWVTVQSSTHYVLVGIRIKGRIQECFLTFFNIAM